MGEGPLPARRGAERRIEGPALGVRGAGVEGAWTDCRRVAGSRGLWAVRLALSTAGTGLVEGRGWEEQRGCLSASHPPPRARGKVAACAEEEARPLEAASWCKVRLVRVGGEPRFGGHRRQPRGDREVEGARTCQDPGVVAGAAAAAAAAAIADKDFDSVVMTQGSLEPGQRGVEGGAAAERAAVAACHSWAGPGEPRKKEEGAVETCHLPVL